MFRWEAGFAPYVRDTWRMEIAGHVFWEIMRRTEKVRLISVLSDEEIPGYEHGFVGVGLIQKYMGQGEFSLFASGPQGTGVSCRCERPAVSCHSQNVRSIYELDADSNETLLTAFERARNGGTQLLPGWNLRLLPKQVVIR